jgi:hypothetical protein
MIKSKLTGFLLLLILFFHINQVNASQRVVTNHLISEPWYESVFLMADKVDNMATKNFTLQVGGGFDSVGCELLYNFPHWYNSKFAPDLFYNDINGDGLRDIIVALVSGAGSGIAMKEIYVLNQIHDPYRRYEEVPVESINDAANRLVKIKRIGNEAIIIIGKKKYDVDLSKFSYAPEHFSPRPWIGSIEKYKPKNGSLYGTTVVFITPSGDIGSLDIGYKWDGKMYKAKSVNFGEAEPYKPSN